MRSDIIELAQQLRVPCVKENSRIWFFRTQSGLFYYDFYLNGYIALGWDLVSSTLIADTGKSKKVKREIISELYPEEKRPGLILGQMDDFYNGMEHGDFVVIPSEGGKTIAIGILGNIMTEVTHIKQESDYEHCKYTHKRAVKWVKQIDIWTDIYLSGILRGQQTISDITQYSDLVYRNLYPIYISEAGVHLTLKKTSSANLRVKDNIVLQSSILKVSEAITDFYNEDDGSDSITIRTAVGSPGFIEIILKYLPSSVITGLLIFRGVLGKVKTSDGEEVTGILAILSKGNDFFNDQTARKKTSAETELIKAQADKERAETDLIKQQARKTAAEAEAVELQNQRARDVANKVKTATDEFQAMAAQNGISFSKTLDEAS